MGGKGIRGARPPSQTVYYVALGGVLGLLLLLCCYFVYYCIRRVKQLVQQGLPERVESVKPPPPSTVAYPVQPEVRASASAMARLCHTPGRGGAGDATSPRALLSPSRERFISAQRSRSLTSAHTNTLPPPSIITPGTTPRAMPSPTPPQRSLPPRRAGAARQHSAPLRSDLPPTRRRDGGAGEETERKRLSAPPRIVVADAQ